MLNVVDIIEKSAIQLFFIHNEVSMQYTIPAQNIV